MAQQVRLWVTDQKVGGSSPNPPKLPLLGPRVRPSTLSAPGVPYHSRPCAPTQRLNFTPVMCLWRIKASALGFFSCSFVICLKCKSRLAAMRWAYTNSCSLSVSPLSGFAHGKFWAYLETLGVRHGYTCSYSFMVLGAICLANPPTGMFLRGGGNPQMDMGRTWKTLCHLYILNTFKQCFGFYEVCNILT